MTRRTRCILRFVAPATIAALASSPAAAQDSNAPSAPQTPAASQAPPRKAPPPPDTRRWEIVIYRAFGAGQPVGGGSGTLPAAGESFVTQGGTASRRVSSWAFGDGAVLLNDVLSSFSRPERITPLDDVLTGKVAEHEVAHGFGVRVTRALTPRMGLEFGVEYAPATFTLLPAAAGGLEATSDSFKRAFDGLVAAGQGVAFTNPVLTSSFTSGNGSGSEMFVTGALVLAPRAGPRFRPYVAAGGGLAIGRGEATATFVGRYAFNLPSGAQVSESDSVTVRFAGGLGIVALAGAGLNVRLAGASGIQVDGRFLLVQNHLDTRVDTAPVVDSSMPADAIWSSFTPGIQFATNPSTGLSSNLTAPPLSGFRTLTGSGFESRLSLTVGYYFRF
jgi:hypothetical protein